MSGVLLRKRLLLLVSNGKPLGDLPSQLCLFQNTFVFKSISSKADPSEIEGMKQSFTVSYLINSCGLSPKMATSVSKKLHFESPEKPDSVITLLRNHKFTKKHISKVVTRFPKVLLSRPEKTLLPKLEFFHSIGVPSADLAKTISWFPEILQRSLEDHIIPSYIYLKSLVDTDENVIYVFKSSPNIFLHRIKEIPPNVKVLRELGVCQSSISTLIRNHPTTLMKRIDKFVDIVNRVTQMGFDSSRLKFLTAVYAVSCMNESAWERKKKAYQRWGWSEDDIRRAFLAYPLCMTVSEKKIMSTMDFLVNKMGYRSADVATYPPVLFFNLEKRTIPRCLVFKMLMLKGLVKSRRLPTFLFMNNKRFLDEFVTEYQEHVPQLLEIYQGKIGVVDISFGSEETSEVKLL